MNGPDSLAAAARSEYLSAVTLAADLEHTLEHQVPLAVTIGDSWAGEVNRVLLVGSGGSYAALLTARYILAAAVDVAIDVIPARDITWQCPAWVDHRTAIVFASYSGETADVMNSVKALAQTGSKTVAITGRSGASLERACDASLVYQGAAIYEVPILLVIALIAHLAKSEGELLSATRRQAETIGDALVGAADRMRTVADKLRTAQHLYVVGSGPQSSLAFKLAAVVMENVRMGASYIDGGEMLHGPIEMFADHRPSVLGLLGVDESRPMTAALFTFFEERGCQVATLDAADAPMAHPLLGPLVLNPWSQWLVAWMAHDRSIADLDARILMGREFLRPGLGL